MTRSARRFVERRAEASSGPAVFPAENVSSPRASFSGDAGRFSPGTAGGRFGEAESPRDDSASPGRTTRLDSYPDDIVPTPRRGDDVSSDEGIHPNDDPSSPMWHAASHRSPLAFSSRGQSSWLFAERETFETTRSSPSATARRPAIPRARPARGCAAATDRGANRRVRGRGCAVARAAPRGRRRPGAGVSPSARRNTRNGFPGEKKETAARRRRPPRVRAADAHHRLFLGVPRARAAGACATHRRRAGCARPRDVQSGDARRRDDGGRLRLRRRRARQTSCARRRRLLRRRRRIVGNAERHARRSARRRARLGITRDASIGAARRAEPRETGRRTPGRFFSARQRARRPGGGPTRLAHGPREPRDVERRGAFSSRR